MPQPYETPQRDCRRCTGYTFPNGCANYCDNFQDEDDFEIEEDDFYLDPSEPKGEVICDNCLTEPGHCPGQFDCEKWLNKIGANQKPIDLNDMEPRTIGFHLLHHDL